MAVDACVGSILISRQKYPHYLYVSEVYKKGNYTRDKSITELVLYKVDFKFLI